MKFTARLLIAATLLFASGCAKTDWIDRTLVTVDVTGSWAGAADGMERDISLDLKQEGSAVKGTMRGGTSGTPGSNVRPIAGTVAGDVFRFQSTRGDFAGELTGSGDEMNGTLTRAGGPGGSPRPVSLRRVDPSSTPASPPR
jgi:hypothetical protein